MSRRAHEFLEYWTERTTRDALRKVEAGYFTDQRWVDAVPVFFEHEVVRDLGCNVAYWNLHERTLAVDEAARGPPAAWRCVSSTSAGTTPMIPSTSRATSVRDREWWRTRSRRSDACSSSGRSG